MKLCSICDINRSIIKRPKTGQKVCKECFFLAFETEIHNTIQHHQLFKRGDQTILGASGGKGI
jgi:cytoplasmic tRNA 2-thiolation protein 1